MIFLIIAFSVVALYVFLLAPGKQIPGSNVFYETKYAHRGLHNKNKSVPENSLAAFALAIGANYGMELDLCLSADGEVVVFHDDTLLRLCGVDKAVSSCTYAELKQYRLLGTDEKIPLFSEVLALIDGRVPLVIELKPTKTNKALCEKTAALLDSYNGSYCIESFHPGNVRWFRKNRPNIMRGQLSAGYKTFDSLPVYQGMLLTSLLSNVLTRPHFVAYRHEDSRHRFKLWLYRLLGGRLIAWTVRDTDDITYCQNFFDAIIFEFFRP